MKTENVVLMRMARESLSGKWTIAVVTFLLYGLLMGSVQGMSEYYPSVALITLIWGIRSSPVE